MPQIKNEKERDKMKELRTINEKQLLGYAMKGVCERILKVPDEELNGLKRAVR
ncbi:MAG: hypothetical protein LBH28_08445 [Oscillospiraceae bacterium]|jgi:hypothetical protein|nr:hypothetical protein [Oscillospiraceae bacterium]